MRSLLILAASSISGCVLSGEVCGLGFELVADRCVPQAAPPPFHGDGRRDAGFPERDAGDTPQARDSGVTRPSEGPWAAYEVIRVIDLTEPADLRAEPDAPGVDLDAVEVIGEDLFAFGVSIDRAEVQDPFGRNRFLDVSAAIGEEDGAWVSLGGGQIDVRLGLSRTLRSGDIVRIAAPPIGNFEVYDVYICTVNEVCDLLGGGESWWEFELP